MDGSIELNLPTPPVLADWGRYLGTDWASEEEGAGFAVADFGLDTMF